MKPWTVEEARFLCARLSDGHTQRDVAVMLGRSPSSVAGRLNMTRRSNFARQHGLSTDEARLWRSQAIGDGLRGAK